MRNYIRYKLWNLISYTFPNIKGAAIEVLSHKINRSQQKGPLELKQHQLVFYWTLG